MAFLWDYWALQSRRHLANARLLATLGNRNGDRLAGSVGLCLGFQAGVLEIRSLRYFDSGDSLVVANFDGRAMLAIDLNHIDDPGKDVGGAGEQGGVLDVPAEAELSVRS